MSLPEACRLSDALAASLRARLRLDPSEADVTGTAAVAARLRSSGSATSSTASRPAARRERADRLLDRLDGRVADVPAQAQRGADVGGLLGPLEHDAARAERDLIVGRPNRRADAHDEARARALRAELEARGAALRDLAARCVAAVHPAPRFAVPDVSALGPVPTEPAAVDAYLVRLDAVGRAMTLAQDMAGEHGVYVALAQLVGFEGGKAFPGGDPGGSAGRSAGPGAGVRRGGHPAELDFEEITRARADLPLLADLEMRLPHLLGSLHATRGSGAGRQQARDRRSSKRGGRQGEACRRPPHPSPRRARRARRSRPSPCALQPDHDPLAIDPELTRRWLRRVHPGRGAAPARVRASVVIGLSGGVDSSLVAYLAAEALGAGNVLGVRMPYRTSSPESLAHAQLVIDALGIPARDGGHQRGGGRARRGHRAETPGPGRLGNIMARTRMITLFDSQRRASGAAAGHRQQDRAPVRLLHLARRRLAAGQPDRRPVQDPGLGAGPTPRRARTSSSPSPRAPTSSRGRPTRATSASAIRAPTRSSTGSCSGYRAPEIAALGFAEAEIELVRKRLDSTHWKRRLPTVAMLSATAIGEYYLRPVDY